MRRPRFWLLGMGGNVSLNAFKVLERGMIQPALLFFSLNKMWLCNDKNGVLFFLSLITFVR